VLTRALERIIDQQPRRPEGLVDPIDLRRADALIELARTRLAQDTDTDRATVVVHVDACVLEGADGVGDIERSGLLVDEAIRRLACDARLQLVIHGADGLPVGIGRTSRNVPAWLARQLRHRDRGCRWPGCGAKHLLRASRRFLGPRRAHRPLESYVAVPLSSSLGSRRGLDYSWGSQP